MNRHTPQDGPQDDAARAFAAMRHLVLDVDDRRREVAEVAGVSFGRAKALRRLIRGPLRMSELAALLVTDKPYTTLVVDDLERRGLVVRSADPDDRRAKVVTLTETGRELAVAAEEILSRPPSGFALLDGQEMAELARLLEKVAGEG